MERWFSIGIKLDTRCWIVDGLAVGAGQLILELIDDILQGTKSWILCGSTDADDVDAFRTIIARPEDGLTLRWAGSSLEYEREQDREDLNEHGRCDWLYSKSLMMLCKT